MDFLEFSDVSAEIKGSMTPGKIKMTHQNIIFKNSKTGKVEQIPSSEMEMVNFQNFIGSWGLRIFLKDGSLHRYTGFKDNEKEKIAKFFANTYKQETLEKELSLKGWNWGTAKFSGSVLSFDIGTSTAFEIPLNHVSQCLTGKNEITMEFHQNDDAAVSLMEMRFFIPSNELAGDLDPVEAFQQQVMKNASVISVSGDAIAIFREIHCLTPRGRYDIKIFNSFFQLHGKTFDYKIPTSTVVRLFLLPHKDTRQMFFVVSLDPPIKQGQTRYHFLVFQFGPDDETTVELPFTDEELKEKYDGKLEKEMSGATHEVLGRVMKNIIGRKITGPGEFVGNSGSPVIGCSFKAAAGFLYPLERGFVYIHKPPIHIRFEEIATVNFARSGGSTRSFDFEIELRSGTGHTFSSIEKEEYAKLYDFCTSKKLHVKNRGKNDKPNYKDDFGDSDNEKAPDAYLERVKAEAQERDEDDGGSEDESTDEDFNPEGAPDSDVALEFDSNHSDTSSDDDDDGEGKEKKKDKHRREKKHKSSRTVSEKPRRPRKEKKEQDDGRPKRPTTAFMLWLNATRESIKAKHPGISVTEIAKKGGEMWRDLKDKADWEKKAAKAKEDYNEAMKEYIANGGSAATSTKSASSSSKSKKPSESKPKSKPASSKTPETPPAKGEFKSKEYIEDSESSDEDTTKEKKPSAAKRKPDAENKEKSKKSKKDESDGDESDVEEDSDGSEKKKKKAPPPKKEAAKKGNVKKEESDNEDDEEEATSTPASGEDSD